MAWNRDFNPRPDHVGFLVNEVELEQDFLQPLLFSSASSGPSMHIH